jgi:hypothetical protein
MADLVSIAGPLGPSQLYPAFTVNRPEGVSLIHGVLTSLGGLIEIWTE